MMARSDDLLAEGVLVPSPDGDGRVVLNVPIYMKPEDVDEGAFSLFAAFGGWTPESPLHDHEFCIQMIWGFVAQTVQNALQKAYVANAIEQARQKAQQFLEK